MLGRGGMKKLSVGLVLTYVYQGYVLPCVKTSPPLVHADEIGCTSLGRMFIPTGEIGIGLVLAHLDVTNIGIDPVPVRHIDVPHVILISLTLLSF